MVNNFETIHLLTESDPLKITIQTNGSWTGFELQTNLESRGIFTELADPYNVLLVLPLLKRGMKYRLQEAAEKIIEIASSIPKRQVISERNFINKKAMSTLAVGYKEMEHLKVEVIKLGDSVGRICAESIIPYPPGIPLCLPGEALSREDVDGILCLKKIGDRKSVV